VLHLGQRVWLAFFPAAHYVDLRCSALQETLTLGLVGRAMLEDSAPALLPLRAPGQPTTNIRLALGSWAAVASMLCFYPDLAPKPEQLTWQGSSSSSGTAAAAAADEEQRGLQQKHYHACVHDMPAAESMYLQGQLKARLEAGDTSAPPVGMYLPPLDMPAPAGEDAAAAAAGTPGPQQQGQQLGQQAAQWPYAAGGAAADSSKVTDGGSSMSLDEVSPAIKTWNQGVLSLFLLEARAVMQTRLMVA
jgi:hypothetical protein